jgi:SSS family solute:Na+ symporter
MFCNKKGLLYFASGRACDLTAAVKFQGAPLWQRKFAVPQRLKLGSDSRHQFMTMTICRFAGRIFSAAVLGGGLVATGHGRDAVEPARRTLREVLARESEWIKVHAAEVLAAQGEKKLVRDVFLAELKAHGSESPYRIGIWRTLALAAETTAARQPWVDRIAAVFVDPAAPDRLHAVETLGKLGGPHSPAVLAALETWLSAASEADAAYGQWVQWQTGKEAAMRSIVGLLRSPAAPSRSRAGYILQRTGTSDGWALAELARAADAEPADSIGRANIVGAAYRLQASPGRLAEWRRILDRIVAEGAPGARYSALQAVMPFYQPVDLVRIEPLLKHEHGDVRIGAAWAFLTVHRQASHRR